MKMMEAHPPPSLKKEPTVITISARKLAACPIEILWDNLNGDFLVQFDDGVIQGNEKDVLYSHYVWDFHRKYPHTPLLKSHFLKDLIKDGLAGGDTHLELIGRVLYTTYDVYKTIVPDPQILLSELAKVGYEVSNRMYNDLSQRLEEYVASFDILDFMQITDHPEIVKVIDHMEPTQQGVDEVYKVARHLIKNDPVFKNNPLVQAANAGVVKMPQVLQCCVLRGFLTDIDSGIYRKPIMRSFVRGIRLLPDLCMESRSAAKSLAFSETPLKKSEYFSRRQQHICMNVRHLHQGDCGSDKYISFFVRDAAYVDGQLVAKGDLKTIAGKYYLDEVNGGLLVVKETDKHLIGKNIKMRSVIAGCAHPDPYGVCQTCYGELSLSVPPNTNIGHHACAYEMQSVSQNVLSTKHYDGSSVVEGIYLESKEAKYLWSPRSGHEYFLNYSLRKHRSVILVLKPDQVPSLTDVEIVDDVRKLDIARISVLDTMDLMCVDDKGRSEVVRLHLTLNKRRANMTHEMLDYIKNKGWYVSEDGNFCIDMLDWDYQKPVTSLPMRHFNMSDHQTEIEDFLEKEDKNEKYDGKPLDVVLIDFHDLVNRKLSVNIAILEIVLLANLIADPERKIFRIPKAWDKPIKGTLREMYEGRSVSALMAYEGHKKTLIDPEQYLHTNRPDHPFDWLLMPREVKQQSPNFKYHR